LRYGILFSGMSFRRHVNGLEFCYRTLVERLGFAADAIYVLNFDGSLRAYGDPEGKSHGVWPGDGTAYRMVVNAEGSRAAFQQALGAIGARLKPDDQLFINITGHGGNRGDEDGPDLITHPFCQRYGRDEFSADLAQLPRHRSLVVLMAQCFSGGFIEAVLAASPAAATYIATATAQMYQSFREPTDGNWDSFQRNWLAAVAGHDVDGSAIAGRGGRRDSKRISVHEAFGYAAHPNIGNPYDSPQFGARPASAGESTL
jgi:hypothetical protein